MTFAKTDTMMSQSKGASQQTRSAASFRRKTSGTWFSSHRGTQNFAEKKEYHGLVHDTGFFNVRSL
jgi:hypothetical protein